MTDIATRINAITAEHQRARAIAGVTGATRTTGLDAAAPSRIKADAITRAERERDARRMTERARHAEATRLARRMRGISDAITIAEREGDAERRARLILLLDAVESARDRYVDATFSMPAMVEDWAPGGRFSRYARRYDLGFIGYTGDDIAQDAAEILAAAGMFNVDGEHAGHTIGDAYRALRHAYRRGLGFYGYQRRGKVVDLTPGDYVARDSETVEYVRESARRDATIVADSVHWQTCEHSRNGGVGDCTKCDELWARADSVTNCDDCQSRDEGEFCDEHEHINGLAELAERRRRALQTLATRFPLNADGRMLALATLLTEGYTIEELTEGLGVQERTLHNWAAELGKLRA